MNKPAKLRSRRNITVEAYTEELAEAGIVSPKGTPYTEETIRVWCRKVRRWKLNGASVLATKAPRGGGWILVVREDVS